MSDKPTKEIDINSNSVLHELLYVWLFRDGINSDNFSESFQKYGEIPSWWHITTHFLRRGHLEIQSTLEG